MTTMRIIGITLGLAVIILYVLWLRFTMRQKGLLAKITNGAQLFDIEVRGVYAPNIIRAKLGAPIKINFTRKENNDCSRFVSFPDFKIRRELPINEKISIEITPDRRGEFLFTCDMSMYQGKLIIE